MRKGFLTIAIGKKYHKMAKTLIQSYRIVQENTIPFGVVTEEGSWCEGLFDDTIRVDESQGSYLNKLNLYDYTPYDETIFIDCDSMVVCDISNWFTFFEGSCVDMSVLGTNLPINHENASKLLSPRAIAVLGLTRYIDFNGGVYYFFKNNRSRAIFERAKSLVPVYLDLQLHSFGGRMGDEPLMEVAMIEAGVFATADYEKNKMYCTPGMKGLKIDLRKRVCEAVKYEYRVYPSVLHWGTAKTSFPLYKREALKAKMLYYGLPGWIVDLISTMFYRVLQVRHRIIKKGIFAARKH